MMSRARGHPALVGRPQDTTRRVSDAYNQKLSRNACSTPTSPLFQDQNEASSSSSLLSLGG